MEIAIALIGLIGSAFGSLMGILVNSKMTNYRLQQLEKKVDKHNTVIERMTIAEKDIKNIYHQLDNIRE